MPSGIDRVEFAYARHWLSKDPEHVTFVLRGPPGLAVAVPRSLVEDFLFALDERRLGSAGWQAASKSAASLARKAIGRLCLGRGLLDLRRALRSPQDSVYLLVSIMWADRLDVMMNFKRSGMKFVPLVHDVIPASFPEYASPAGTRRHFRIVDTFARLADGVIANSTSTAQEITPHFRRGDHDIPMLCAPLGIDMPAADMNFPIPAEPYFVCIGTIEPRKNHLMLLNTWRVLAERLGSAAPKLILIGRRGWENENILDMLDRCPALVGLVREYNGLPDKAVARLLQGAQALLFPSFVEGYGLPLAEALSLGVPAICSDLPALREVGGSAPDYLDPLDGLGWRRLILGYAEHDSRMRQAQLERLKRWAAPSWDHHFSMVEPWLQQIALAPAGLVTRQLAAGIPARSMQGVVAAPSSASP
ncbi:MAG: glycosyltransferase family 4 protein [Roseomonas sp.]|nr:glycosyltransferase family 4 protein [Roseomonas sp.]